MTSALGHWALGVCRRVWANNQRRARLWPNGACGHYPTPTTRRPPPGYTILELFVAISITAIVSGSVFGAYIGMTRGFGRHTRNAAGVREMMRLKIKLGGLLVDGVEVEEAYGSGIRFRDPGTGTRHTLQLRTGKLRLDGVVVVEQAESFSCTLTDSGLLLWELTMSANRWIGGACRILGDGGFLAT